MKIDISLISGEISKNGGYISLIIINSKSLFTFSYRKRNKNVYQTMSRIFISLFFFFRKEIIYNIKNIYKNSVKFNNCICPYCQKLIPEIELYNVDECDEGYEVYINELFQCPNCKKIINANYVPHLGDTTPDLY